MLVNIQHSRGFTLVELVIGTIIFAIATVLLLALIVPQAKKSVDPIFQVRATELAQSLMSEIISKPFDENSSRTGSMLRCNESGASACTPIDGTTNSNIEEGVGNRDEFDDVDDYNGLSASGANIKNSLGQDLAVSGAEPYHLYQGFSVLVSVFYDDNRDGIDDGVSYVGDTKLVRITVTTPNDESMVFSTYRANY